MSIGKALASHGPCKLVLIVRYRKNQINYWLISISLAWEETSSSEAEGLSKLGLINVLTYCTEWL